jgi:hypothetical protein
MLKSTVNTSFKTPPRQKEKSKKIDAKFKLAHLKREAERLISYKSSHSKNYNPNKEKDKQALWSKTSGYRW